MTQLNKLNIRQRFLAGVCFFLLPMGALFYSVVSQVSEKMNFARSEIMGTRLQGPALRLIKGLAAWRFESLSTGLPVRATSAKQEVDEALRQLEEQSRESDASFVFDDPANDAGAVVRLAGLRTKWLFLSAAPDPGSKAASEEYEQLMSEVRSLIAHIGDASKLTLDPEMDSYYLADVTSATVPQSLNRIGAAVLAVGPSVGSREMTPSVRTQAAIYSAALKESDLDRITGDLETALKENARSSRGPSPALKSNIETAVAQYRTDLLSFIEALASVAQGRTVDAGDFHDRAARASQSTFDLGNKTSSELDNVLAMRIRGLVRYRWKVIFYCTLLLEVLFAVLLWIVRGVTHPLVVALTHVQHVARGELSVQLPADYLKRGDEIGALARAMHGMSEGLRSMVRQIGEGVDVLSSSASNLEDSSAQMKSESRDASDKAHSVAAAAEEMSSIFTSVAAGMEQTTTNLSNVAHATNQMTVVIEEIAGNSEKARNISRDARTQAQLVTEQISQLSEAARQIGKVTETITEISSQTNLLALNATIEAARAGAAGKGFAVVANEIKQLAQQATAATGDIKNRIAGVQASTASGVAEIEKVSSVIHEMSRIVSTIAVAIEEQAVTTRDISRNITEASQGVRDVNGQVAQSSQASTEIARDIGAVDQVASRMAEGSGGVRSTAEEVARISGQLKRSMERFKV